MDKIELLEKLIMKYIKDWFSFLSKDEFQAFVVIVILVSIFKATGFIDAEFFEKVFIFVLGFSFADNTVSTVARSFTR